MRAVAGRPVKVRFKFEDEGGILTDVDSSTTVNVAVLSGAGTLVTSGTAAKDGSNTGVYAFTVPAQTQLDVLSATAVGTLGGAQVSLTEPVKLADRRITPLSTLRQEPTLANLSVADFLAVVDMAEDAITTELNFSPVVVGARFEWRSRETARLFVPGAFFPQQVYTLTRNDEDQLTTPVNVRANALERGYGADFGYGYFDPLLGVTAVPFLPGVYKAWLSHGWTRTPADLSKACTMLARHYAQIGANTAYPDRATRIMTEASEIWLARPGSDAPFGIPEVDAAIVRHRIPEPFPDDPGSF